MDVIWILHGLYIYGFYMDSILVYLLIVGFFDLIVFIVRFEICKRNPHKIQGQI